MAGVFLAQWLPAWRLESEELDLPALHGLQQVFLQQPHGGYIVGGISETTFRRWKPYREETCAGGKKHG